MIFTVLPAPRNREFKMTTKVTVPLDTKTQFLLSTSGSESSIVKHNTMLQHFGVNVAYFSFTHEISAQCYANLLRAPMVRGGAVTGQGLKTAIVGFLDKVDEDANRLGAVNTVINKNGTLWGYNTDAFGLETAIRNHQEISGMALKTAVIYGNGGVSGVAYHTLRKLGLRVTMRGRDPGKVAAQVTKLRISDFAGPYDLVVNATPVSNASLKNAAGLEMLLAEAKVVFDHNMPEKDGKKNYLAEACKISGTYFIPGSDMYLPQMIRQWALFLDETVSLETLKNYCVPLASPRHS